MRKKRSRTREPAREHHDIALRKGGQEMAAETRCACWVLLWYLFGGFVMLPKLEPQLPFERTGKCGETAWEGSAPQLGGP